MKRTVIRKLDVKIGKFIDPLSDFGFKRLFGSEPNKDLLIDFLNDLFAGRKVIADLTYNKNEQLGPRPESRKAIYDLTCTGQDGEQFIIEVQRIRQSYFKDRAVYYSSLLIHDQTPRDSHWDYSLKEVYFIGIMDFALDDSDTQKYMHRVQLTYRNTGRVFYDKLEFIFIEIPKFVKSEKELKTGIDKWLFVLKNMSRLKKIPVILNNCVFAKLFNIAAVSNLTKEDYMKYEKDLMAEWDEYGIKKTLIEQGWEEGRKEGMEKKSREVVKNLLKAGKFTISEIANFASVSEAFVRKVKKNMK